MKIIVFLHLYLLLFISTYSQEKDVDNAQLFFIQQLASNQKTQNDTLLAENKTSNFFAFIFTYKKVISRHDIPDLCKFYPSCGSYGAIALKKHGLIKGTLTTFDRLQRCNGKHYKNQYLFLPSQNKYLDLP
ncbi:MAG: membrane protein insertion efficiency factor YidD [Bacteroidetes bacterium]|nr:MAG: membrane protein insertion efficiency factor YidD [Bacteroidota bacterium]